MNDLDELVLKSQYAIAMCILIGGNILMALLCFLLINRGGLL